MYDIKYSVNRRGFMAFLRCFTSHLTSYSRRLLMCIPRTTAATRKYTCVLNSYIQRHLGGGGGNLRSSWIFHQSLSDRFPEFWNRIVASTSSIRCSSGRHMTLEDALCPLAAQISTVALRRPENSFWQMSVTYLRISLRAHSKTGTQFCP
jgi:hypothetical protein